MKLDFRGDCFWVYVVAANLDEARALSRGAVQNRWAACANILGTVESIFWWKEQLETAKEVSIVFKTQESCLEGLTHFIRENHSYETPAVVALKVQSGPDDFLAWIRSESSCNHSKLK